MGNRNYRPDVSHWDYHDLPDGTTCIVLSVNGRVTNQWNVPTDLAYDHKGRKIHPDVS